MKSVLGALLGISLLGCGPGDTVALSVQGDTVALSVQVAVPATVPTIDAGELYLSLWTYDPGIADARATLADVDRAAFRHAVGERNTLVMRVAGHVPDGWRYYITVEGCRSTPQGRVAVLWDGIEGTAAPSVVEMQYRTTPTPCQGAP